MSFEDDDDVGDEEGVGVDGHAMALVARLGSGELVEHESFSAGQLVGGVERVLQSMPSRSVSFWVQRGGASDVVDEFGLLFEVSVSGVPGFPHLEHVLMRPRNRFCVDAPVGVVGQLDLMAMAYGFGVADQVSVGEGWVEVGFERLSDVEFGLEGGLGV